MSIETKNNYMAKIAMNKSVLKEYHNGTDNRVVYLNNNDEFQICLFNPERFTIGAEISINGEREDGLIVVRPGERVWIERPLGKQRKYKFEIYEVEDSAVAASATKNNGDIVVRFYKEKQRTWQIPVKYRTVSGYDTFSSSNFLAMSDLSISSCAKGIADNDNTYRSIATPINAQINATELNCDIADYDFVTNSATTSAKIDTIETGRVTTGKYSSQEFTEIDMDFNTWAYKTETIKLLPMSRKPYTSSDLQKIYCTECGRKLNSKFKYCPYCGNKCQFYEE